jgi:hypothetical protein
LSLRSLLVSQLSLRSLLISQMSLRSSLNNAEPVLRESAFLTSIGLCQRKPRLIISQVCGQTR